MHDKEEIDYKNYYENERKSTYDFKEYEITTKVSKVYDLKDDVKNVFVKSDMKLNGKNEINDINIVVTKKYVITKENNEWKISKDYIDLYEKEKPKRLNYTVFNSSERVEYITSFTVSNKNK